MIYKNLFFIFEAILELNTKVIIKNTRNLMVIYRYRRYLLCYGALLDLSRVLFSHLNLRPISVSNTQFFHNMGLHNLPGDSAILTC